MSLPTKPTGESAQLWVMLACLFAGLSVAAGAFGAHALRGAVTERDLEIFQTAAQYQMYHALALLGVAWGRTRWPGKRIDIAGNLFVAGILLFSGSLYALVLTNTRWLGAITPFGGMAFLAGWAIFGVTGWKNEEGNRQ